ncbi:MAG: twin-arginine translocase subunit TatC [Planctomycetes bacterium]|nr:twin-arginine translocase subunit TatC [Planctomycetota bacterium]
MAGTDQPIQTGVRNDAPDDRPKPLGEHFTELRRRVLVAMGAVVAATLAAWWQYPLLDRAVRFPHERAFRRLGVEASLQTLSPTEVLVFILKIGVVTGLVLASPLIIYEAWSFVRPGLTRREKRVLAPVFLLGLFFFLTGAAVAYYWVVPTALFYLAHMGRNLEVMSNWTLTAYVNFLLAVLLSFGVAFELPLVMLGLGASGIVRPSAFLRPIRIVIVAAFVLGAILTPPDVTTQIIMALMLMALYFIGILFARIGHAWTGRTDT